MGFYLRKSISVGPFRFNLSRSGIGVSAGIKGLRIGAGPRGNYIHMGRGGVYYSKTLTPASHTPVQPSSQSPIPQPYPDQKAQNSTHEAFKEIESGSVEQMVDSSSAELLEELNSKRKRMRLWPLIAAAGIMVVLFVGKSDKPSWAAPITALLSCGAVILAYNYDKVKKSTVLFYNLEDHIETAYQGFHEAFDKLAGCSQVWNIDAESKVLDRKYHAGASKLIKRQTITLARKEPQYVKTNLSIPAIPVGRQTLYFLPDRVLVFDKDGVGTVNYKSLQLDVSQTQFIEDEGAPADSKIVGQTWKYVNKKGGPDKRFKNNPQLPVVLYETINFTSSSGLNEVIFLSRTDTGGEFRKAVFNLANLS